MQQGGTGAFHSRFSLKVSDRAMVNFQLIIMKERFIGKNNAF